jgi:hypothetical protein
LDFYVVEFFSMFFGDVSKSLAIKPVVVDVLATNEGTLA